MPIFLYLFGAESCEYPTSVKKENSLMAKQNKKSFSDNLESLMEYNLYEDNLQDNTSVLDAFKKKIVLVEEDSEEPEKKTDAKKKTSRKSFSDGLESFFKESIEEAIGDSTVTEMKRGVIKKGKQKAIGIEILLQRTLSENQDETEEERNTSTRRITFVIDTEKADLLKNIARKEKQHIKQIVGRLVEEYLQKKKKK